MDALDDHLDRIATASHEDWAELLAYFRQQAHPWRMAELRLARTFPLDDEAWERSEERHWLLQMCERCWPSERSQRQ